MEQTSSAAYPNILVADYVKKARVANPQILMKAEEYLNVGYQKLLTFERPGGGFDWWGNGPPLVWLSAYGLQEFNDMAKVYPIDKGVIDRTQKWLMSQQEKDGSWSNIGATHGETITRMGDPKLLLTSYVAWALLESGAKPVANAPGSETAAPFVGKAILFAKRSLEFPKKGPWTSSVGRKPIEKMQDFADIPESGRIIKAGAPILTFLAQSTTMDGCLDDLKERVQALDHYLWKP